MSLEGAIAVTRFGLGAQEGEITLASRSPQDWLLAQLHTERVDDAIKDPAFSRLMSSASAVRLSSDYRRNRKEITGDAKAAATKTYNKTIGKTFQAAVRTRAVYAARTDIPFHERLTRFWSNHFSVSARNGNTRLLAGAYEHEAIRPHISGQFYDLASAAIFHPGMLFFLDNVGSTGPGSRAGRRRNKGLNENLAREVLELHTVTPAARYTQSDVTEFAKALTGWSVDQSENGSAGESFFNNRLHEPGRRTVLGRTYPGIGQNQALAVLKDICLRPETARNIAKKLAIHFVSDVPPADLVKDLTESFLATQGDLGALYETLVNSPRAWEAAPQKVKTPEELLISTSRMIGLENVFPKRARDSYESLAQRPFSAPTPEGWPDTAEAWIGPDAIMKRIEWANELASRLPELDARLFLQSALGARASKDTLQSVARAESGQQALVLALMSPDFQRR